MELPVNLIGKKVVCTLQKYSGNLKVKGVLKKYKEGYIFFHNENTYPYSEYGRSAQKRTKNEYRFGYRVCMLGYTRMYNNILNIKLAGEVW